MSSKISKHISYKEATKSNTAAKRGISNIPNEKELFFMQLVAERCFEPVRKHHGKAIGISSFFRSKALNKAVGGSKTSQHRFGQAIDIDADIFDNGITNAEIFHFIKDNLKFTQLIWEYGNDEEPNWVHVGYDPNNLKGQVLICKRVKGRTKYYKW